MNGNVYVIHAKGTEFYKIGSTKSVARRLAGLSTSCPYPVELFMAIQTEDREAIESKVHLRFAANRRHGEWFHFTDVELLDLRSVMLELGSLADPSDRSVRSDSSVNLWLDRSVFVQLEHWIERYRVMHPGARCTMSDALRIIIAERLDHDRIEVRP